MTANNQLATKLSAAGAAMVPSAFENNVKTWYATNKKKVVALAGDEQRAALFIASMFAQINRVPELLQCKPESLFQCLIYSLGTNLLPGPTNEAYYIPFGKEATFIPSYQGLIKLMYNGGFVTRVTGHVVYERDEFYYDCANEVIRHVPANVPNKDRGKRIGAYVMVKNIYGEVLPMYKTAEFIEGIKARSRGAQSKYSPWNSEHPSDVDAMWLKTVIRQASKFVPKNSTPQAIHLSKALELANSEDMAEPVLNVELLQEEIEHVQQEILKV